MPPEEQEVIRLKNDFYRDGFYKVVIALCIMLTAIALVVVAALYLFFSKPQPVYFQTDNEWRVLPSIPLSLPFLNTPDLQQWVSEVVPAVFTLDFVNYPAEQASNNQYFTEQGWNRYLDQLNTYANADTVQAQKTFINTTAGGAPLILNKGLLSGKYGWWVQMPINVSYSTLERSYTNTLTVQVLVVRIPTLNNLNGVAIDNLNIVKGAEEVRANA